MNRLVFTDWYTVIFNGNREVPLSRFFRELEGKLKTKEYNVYYDENTMIFIITYNGTDYEVLLPINSQKSLKTKEYTPLVLKLILLARNEEIYSDIANKEAVRETKIKEINDSFYEDIETIEDYELYLDYLKKSLSKAKTEEEKHTINTKIASIINIVNNMKKEEKQKRENPLNLQLHINRFIYNIIKQLDKINEKDRKMIGIELKKIILEYYKIIKKFNSRKDTDLVVGNPVIPMEILSRIIDLEALVDTILKKQDTKETVSSELKGIEDDLHSIINNSEGGKKL